jgi:PhnB protein
MQASTHVVFDGRCEEAFRFYEKSLKAKIAFMMKWGEAPGSAEHAPPGWSSKIIHASLTIGDSSIAGADSPPEHYKKPQGFYVTLSVNEPAEAERVFGALADGGTIQMPIQETFWALRYGSLVDRFGIPWEINCSKPA